jgi:hypothetical protein
MDFEATSKLRKDVTACNLDAAISVVFQIKPLYRKNTALLGSASLLEIVLQLCDIQPPVFDPLVFVGLGGLNRWFYLPLWERHTLYKPSSQFLKVSGESAEKRPGGQQVHGHMFVQTNEPELTVSRQDKLLVYGACMAFVRRCLKIATLSNQGKVAPATTGVRKLAGTEVNSDQSNVCIKIYNLQIRTP